MPALQSWWVGKHLCRVLNLACLSVGMAHVSAPASPLPRTAVAVAVAPHATSAAPGSGADSRREPVWRALWPQGVPGARGSAASDQPALLVFPLGNLPVTSVPAARTRRPGFLICPGGAYGLLAWDREGVAAARWLNDRGVFAAVLRYRLGPVYRHPAPYQDAQRGMRWLRAHAAEYGLDPRRLGMLGFSAGGHLTATVATHGDSGGSAPRDSVDRQSCRPDLQVLIYPVISMEAAWTHVASRINLLGRNPAPESPAFLSAEKYVHAGDPPAFIVHARTDPIVSFANSEAYFTALAKARVPVEFHAYALGGHAFGVAPGRALAGADQPERARGSLPELAPEEVSGAQPTPNAGRVPSAAPQGPAGKSYASAPTVATQTSLSESRLVPHAEAPDQWTRAFQAWLTARGWLPPGS